MCKPLPIGEYSWLDSSELAEFSAAGGDKITQLGETDEYGCVFEVDLDYPE